MGAEDNEEELSLERSTLSSSAPRQTHEIEMIPMVKPTVKPEECVRQQSGDSQTEPSPELLRQQQTGSRKAGEADTREDGKHNKKN